MSKKPVDPTDQRLLNARENLRIALAIRNITAAEVSVAAGLSVNAFGSFLRGKSSISYVNLLKICDQLNVPIGMLHRPGGITPARLRLQSAIDDIPPETVETALRATGYL